MGVVLVKQMLKFLLTSLLVLLFVSGCNTNTVEESIFKFTDSYVGDNSGIGNIVNQLLGTKQFVDFKLETKEERTPLF